MANLHDVLARGYLPKELPLAFRSESYADALTAPTPPSAFRAGGPWRNCVRHNLARPGLLVRTLAIPDPVNFYRLASLMVREWHQIASRIAVGPYSITEPVDDTARRRAWVPTDNSRVDARAFHASHARFVATADVSQWYPSIYTHSLDWAIRGKSVAKADRRIRKTGLGPMLDVHVRRAQAGQTIGLPIGPDTSFVLAELVLAQVDELLAANATRNVHGFRYYDDYEIFGPSQHEVEAAIAELIGALGEWQLILNPHKWATTRLPIQLEDPWISVLRRLSVRSHASQERADVTTLFDEAFGLAHAFPKEQVLSYALGRFVTRDSRPRRWVRLANWPHFERLLLQVALSEPGTLAKVAHLMHWAREAGRPLDLRTLEAALNLLGRERAARGDSSEVAWALWVAVQFNVPIRAGFRDAACQLTDDVVALAALHARDAGLITRLDTARWEPLMTLESLQGDHWLLAYEALVHGWLPSADGSDYIAADPAFAGLRTRGVRFYDETAALPSARTTATAPAAQPPAQYLGPTAGDEDEEPSGPYE